MTAIEDDNGRRVVQEDDSMRPHKDEREVEERRQDADALEKRVTRLATRIRESKSVTVLTGAGVSTSLGIPDYRGPNGKWTLVHRMETTPDPEERERLAVEVAKLTDLYLRAVVEARPSVAHMALVSLVRAGLVKSVITTNTDGLHIKSGLHPLSVYELHGNSTKARCSECAKCAYSESLLRRKDADPATFGDGASHELPIRCFLTEGCGGTLHDTIVHFGETLQPEVQRGADESTRDIDCLITLGTSLRIVSCMALMDIGSNNGCFAIVNLQRTEYDHLARVRIFHDCDTVMTMLCAQLGVTIAPFVEQRFLEVSWSADGKVLSVSHCDEAGAPFARDCELSLETEGETLSAQRTESFDLERIETAQDKTRHPWRPVKWTCLHRPRSLVATFDRLSSSSPLRLPLEDIPTLESWSVRFRATWAAADSTWSVATPVRLL